MTVRGRDTDGAVTERGRHRQSCDRERRHRLGCDKERDTDRAVTERGVTDGIEL